MRSLSTPPSTQHNTTPHHTEPFSLMALHGYLHILFILEDVLVILCVFYSLWLLLRLTISPTASGSPTAFGSASILLCIVVYLSILRLMRRDSALAVLFGIVAAVTCIILLLVSFLQTLLPPPPPPPAAPANAAP